MSENELDIVEELDIQESTMSDDVLANVLLCGKTSTNKRVYTESYMKEGLTKYMNAPVYVNHKPGERNLEDRFGVATNVRITEKGLVGDIKVLTNHPLYEMIKESYDKKMYKIGMSHNVRAMAREREDGITEISAIDSVKSIDIVSNPGTVMNFHENENAELVSLKEQVETLKADLVTAKIDAEKIVSLEEQVKDLTNDKLLLTAKVTALEGKNKWVAPKSFGLEITENAQEIDITDKNKLAKWLLSK